MRNVKQNAIKIITWAFIFVGTLMLLTIALYNLNFGGRIPPYRATLRYEHRLTSFYSGSNRLTAYIFGENNDQGLIVISHGLGGGGLSYIREITYFVEQGWRVFAFDKTGSHHSEGRGTRGLPQSAIDLNAALDYIASQDWGLPIMLYGHSWGGFAVTAVLNFEHEINAVVSLAGFAEPFMMLQEGARAMIGRPLGRITSPFLWVYQRMLFGDYADLCAITGINRAEVPVMIIHGNRDNVVLYDGSGIIAHRERISNPNAVFVSRYYPNRSGHNDLILDPFLMREINAFFLRNI